MTDWGHKSDTSNTSSGVDSMEEEGYGAPQVNVIELLFLLKDRL